MANIETATIDNGIIELRDGEFRDEYLTFAAADTFAKGTILARQGVATAVTASAVTGTGNGTVTSATVVEGPVVPIVGAYVLTVTTAVTHGGIWKLVDPNGASVANGLIMTATTGAATAFEAGGLRFTITDGATDFAVGDTATLTVAAVAGGGKLVPFSPSGAAGAQTPCAILTYEVTKASSGDIVIRALHRGVVNRNRLIIDADGDGTNINNKVIDQLKAAGITAIDVQQLGGVQS